MPDGYHEPEQDRYVTVRELLEYTKETTEWRVRLERRVARMEFVQWLNAALLIFTALAAVYAAMKA